MTQMKMVESKWNIGKKETSKDLQNNLKRLTSFDVSASATKSSFFFSFVCIFTLQGVFHLWILLFYSHITCADLYIAALLLFLFYTAILSINRTLLVLLSSIFKSLFSCIHLFFFSFFTLYFHVIIFVLISVFFISVSTGL